MAYRTATYWPPGSWETGNGQNVAVRIQALWTQCDGLQEVFLQTDVSEGGYLYDGISNAQDPRTVEGARRIDLYLHHPDLRTLKQIRKAILAKTQTHEYT